MIDISYKIWLKFLSSTSGMLFAFSFVKTLAKYSLRVLAVSWSLDVKFPFDMRSFDTDDFVLDFCLT